MSIEFIGMACALGLSAMGSAFGAGFAAQASVGAWKKCYANGKPAPFIMVAFSGAPLTQTIYGFLLMNFIRSAVASGADPALAMFTGIFAGLAIGLSAFFQGKVAAASADALGETGKGTANFFIVIGIIETVGEVVDHAALALVAPVDAYDRTIRHDNSLLNISSVL